MKTKREIKFSIFLKLIILIIIFTVLVNVSIGFILRRSFDRAHMRPPASHMIKMHQYILNDIGNPPDTVKADQILKDVKFDIRFETSSSKWTSNIDLPTIEELKNRREFDDTKSSNIIRSGRRLYRVIKLDDGYVIFAQPSPIEEIDIESVIFPVIIIFSVLAFLLYISLRWIFGPIKKLSEGVKKISSGDLDSRIEVKGNDELENLATSINEMSVNISGMLKAKETLLIDVSHELRSPLTRIKLANEFVEEEKIKKNIREDVIEMESMISGMLETYRAENTGQKPDLKKTDIVPLLKNVISKFSYDKIDFQSKFEKRELLIDPDKIETAFRNILDNAVKYSENKSIEIFISGNESDETVVTVKDHGRGIGQEEISKIFEPFYRVDKSRDKKITGYGLGLSIVKKILDMHKAKTEITSKPGEGTEFRIIFIS
ncbi:MAG TPA: HAMP domain-containing sensor histidine kinase [Ignavibacteria bacterium]|nr:HAMP domain-containing sensor histidine kinase [Ignavibacteria bacterium]HMR40033.1 HAMP domain-containing sensor histidine kinase [Ignavibacteria bacterium]